MIMSRMSFQTNAEALIFYARIDRGFRIFSVCFQGQTDVLCCTAGSTVSEAADFVRTMKVAVNGNSRCSGKYQLFSLMSPFNILSSGSKTSVLVFSPERTCGVAKFNAENILSVS